MKQGFIFLEKAEADVEEIVRYIAFDNPQAGEAFRAALQSACEMLADLPEAGSARSFGNPELKSLRLWRIPGFKKYLIFYHNTDEGVEIVRVLHSARDIPSLFEKWQGEDNGEKKAA